MAMRIEAAFVIAKNIRKMRRLVGETNLFGDDAFKLEDVDYDEDDAAWNRLEAEERRLIRIVKSRKRGGH